MPTTGVFERKLDMPITTYYWDVDTDNVFLEEDENGDVVAEYTQEPDLHGELIAQKRDGQVSFYHYDGQGSTLALTDENGAITDTYTYSAFGETIASTGTTVNPYRYIGSRGYQYNEETNDYYVRERVYEPAIARWMSVDPIFPDDGPNAYMYVNNSPATVVDASGLCAPCCCCVTELNFKFLRNLKPNDKIDKCFGNKPRQVGSTSYGNEFLVVARFANIQSTVFSQCQLEWWERSSTVVPGVGLKPCDKRKNQMGPNESGPLQNTFRKDQSRLSQKCPSLVDPTAFARDCPIEKLDKKSNRRLLCIEVVWKSSCPNCMKTELKLYIKQVCKDSACKIESSPNPICTKKDWKNYCK